MFVLLNRFSSSYYIEKMIRVLSKIALLFIVIKNKLKIEDYRM